MNRFEQPKGDAEPPRLIVLRVPADAAPRRWLEARATRTLVYFHGPCSATRAGFLLPRPPPHLVDLRV